MRVSSALVSGDARGNKASGFRYRRPREYASAVRCLSTSAPKAEWCPREVLDSLLELAIEIAGEGREGRRIGTLFTVGFVDSVMYHSRPLILDPLALHTAAARRVTGEI